MLNNLMNIINGLEEFDVSDTISAEDINEFGLITMRSNDILGLYGMVIAGMFAADEQVVGKENVRIIIVDDNFYELKEETKKFIIGHELGHSQHEVQIGQYIRKINDEFEADEYAAKLIGLDASINALKEMKQLLIDDYFCNETDENIVEIDIRIENLMNKFMVTC